MGENEQMRKSKNEKRENELIKKEKKLKNVKASVKMKKIYSRFAKICYHLYVFIIFT